MKKFIVLAILIVIFVFFFIYSYAYSQEKKIIVKETYIMNIPLIVKADDYCGFFLKENVGEILGKISYSGDETFKRATYHNGDILYAKLNSVKGIEKGNKFLVLKETLDIVGTKNRYVYGGVGIVRVIGIDAEKNSVKLSVVSMCDPIERGFLIVNYIDRKPFKGEFIKIPKNLEEKDFLAKGNILFIKDNFQIADNGMQIVIDAGKNKGLERGKQLIFYRKKEKTKFLEVLGFGIVISSSKTKSVVKVLKQKDPVTLEVKWGLLK